MSRPAASTAEAMVFIFILQVAGPRNEAPPQHMADAFLPRVSRLYFAPASAFAMASLQPSLRSAACDLTQSARRPLPNLVSEQSFLTSALQARPTAAALTIATWQSVERSEKCSLTQAFSAPPPGFTSAHSDLMSLAHARAIADGAASAAPQKSIVAQTTAAVII